MIRISETVGLDDPAMLAVAQVLMQAGQAEGAIPPDRQDLTGGEAAIFAYAPTALGAETAIGCVVFYQPDGHDMMFVDVLFVVAQYRRMGIGRQLLQAACREATIAGVARVEFGTLVDNKTMQALGRRLGFTDRAVFMSRDVGEVPA